MSMTDDGQTLSADRLTLSGLSMASALGIFALMQGIALSLNGGVFDYPLDDPYIHLALSEVIAQGGYGVNLGEPASPGSSALFPLLLVPFAGTEFHRYMPLIWSVVGLTISAWLWGRLLIEAGFARADWRWLGRVAALLGPIAIMMPMVAFLGMEHSLHVAATLALFLGLHRHISDKRGLGLILVGAFFGTAFRIEGLAPGLIVAVALFFTGRRKGGLATVVATLLPVVVFAGFLVSQGLDPLPSSVQTKLNLTDPGAQVGFVPLRLAILLANLQEPAGLFVAVLAVATFLMWRVTPIKGTRWSTLALVVFAAAFAHMLAGQIGWLNRYENYILAFTAAGFLSLLPKATEGAVTPLAIGGVAALVLGGAVAYRLPMHFFELPPSVRAIHTQQGQMATFVKDYLQTGVAVNDLGYVAWQNDNYILDLWGLASAEARTIRATAPVPGWTGELTAKYDVPVALVYDPWFEDGIGTDWVKVGEFQLTIEGGYLGGYVVSFYATTPKHVDQLTDAVEAWIPTLLPHSRFVWAEGMEP
ncbi:MAG: hypothetical protein VX874_10270 [Pseudomonadota bacterium]|nr:hypothetical protein [Pseudomonadota bacterium]